MLETLPLVLSGKAAVDSELDANKSAVSMRSLPLMDANGRVGAVVLCRDVTELRRREKELQTKDATISENPPSRQEQPSGGFRIAATAGT